MLEIDGVSVEADEGKTLLEAARSAGISIPTLCYHPALEPFGACRLCSVEIEKRGRRRIVTACNYPAEDGLVVRTGSAEVINIRKMILELLAARCPGEERISRLAREYGVLQPRFKLEAERCMLCGLCTRVCEELVGLCAITAINRGVERRVDAPYSDLSEECIGCGSCAMVCPTGAVKDMRNIYPVTQSDLVHMEDEFLSGTRDDDLGVYSQILAGKASRLGQDGGMVTSMLASGLEKGLIDAAVVVTHREFYGAQAILADGVEEILGSRGTKYVRTSVISTLRNALRSGKRRIAVVGTPCQVRAVRRLQHQGYIEEEFPGTEITILGLFCFESFDYEALRDHTMRMFGIDLEDADRIQIARGKYVISAGGEDHSCKVRELEDDVSTGCGFCSDFVSRLADISVGSVGSPEGYSTLVVRSDAGRRLMETAEFSIAQANPEEIFKLARLKKKNAQKSFARITDGLEMQV